MEHTSRTSLILLVLFALTLGIGRFAEPWVRAPVQRLFAAAGQGNEQVVLARDGWMYFRPALDHLVGAPIQDDARPAISHFREELARAGIELLVVPVPVKATVDGKALGLRRTRHNAGWRSLRLDLQRYGVHFVDVEAVLDRRPGPHYLRTDTHWTPAAMDAVAEAIADEVRTLGFPKRSHRPRSSAVVTGHGDLVELLGIGTDGLPPETVETAPLRAPLGDTRGAPVLLIGDSFANIYADPSLGFGEGAGLQAALAHHLGADIDALLQNDGGASKTRLALQEDLGRLDETLVVVWVFAARELSSGTWIRTPLALDAPTEVTSPYLDLPPGTERLFTGTVRARSEVPDPASAPYADHLVMLRVQSAEGEEAFVRLWSMRGRALTEAAELRVGAPFRATLRPWSEAPAAAASASRSELDDRPQGAPVAWGTP